MLIRSETGTATLRPATGEECRALVGRIAASREFRRAARLREFLAYVVDRYLAGSKEEITEPLIGRRVFGRSESYHPGEDSIVRTEARTLRQRLARYFSEEGADEPLILEIPRGGYVPVFRWRSDFAEKAAEPAPLPLLTRRTWIGSGAVGLLAAAAMWRGGRPAPRAGQNASSSSFLPAGQVRFESADPRLDAAFEFARKRAMSCVYTGDPVGDWYATRPAGESDVFCMRDVSHQSTGAAVLGLTRHTANMLRAFARSISRKRDWCGYWVITKDGFPAPSNYTSDSDFGYGLPANFDVMRACYRQLLWTGDSSYLNEIFSAFYSRSVAEYVEAWDPEHSGIMTDVRRARVRASYHASGPRLITGADLVAAQYAGYRTYAAIQEFKGTEGSLSQRVAREYRQKAQSLQARFNRDWWSAAQNRFFSGMLEDRSWDPEFVSECNMYSLWFGIPEDGPKRSAALDLLAVHPPEEAQARSYTPEVLYRYGRNEQAFAALQEIGNPRFFGHEVAAEVSFAVLGAVAAGMMGIEPHIPSLLVQTRPRLTRALAWAKLSRLPIGRNVVTVEHRGPRETRFTNHSGAALQWQAAFQDAAHGQSRVLVDGPAPASVAAIDPLGQPIVSALVPVAPGQTRTARLA